MAPRQVPVGVLLPVRLETRFHPGQLFLRIVPDEPWFTSHDPRISDGELGALTRYVDAVQEPSDGASTAQAWRELVAQVGGARAVFLLRTFTATDRQAMWPCGHRRPTSARRSALTRIGRFPEQLQVWLARAGHPPAPAAILDVKRDRLLADFPDPDIPGDRRWWEDWEEAKQAGLAAEIGLAGDPTDIDALFVTGLSAESPAPLLTDQRAEGRLALVAPGTATNTVDGAPATPLGNDPDTWREVLLGATTDTERLVSRALSGDPDLLGPLPGSAEPHRAMASAVVAALWPALWFRRRRRMGRDRRKGRPGRRRVGGQGAVPRRAVPDGARGRAALRPAACDGAGPLAA